MTDDRLRGLTRQKQVVTSKLRETCLQQVDAVLSLDLSAAVWDSTGHALWDAALNRVILQLYAAVRSP